MIQRLQTLFLLGVVISMLLVLAFPIWEKISVEEQQMVSLTAFTLQHTSIDTTNAETPPEIIDQTHTIIIAILAMLAAGIAGFSIFQYNNRLMQMKLGALNSLIMAGTLGASMYYIISVGNEMLEAGYDGDYRIGLFFPGAAIIFNVMANKFIRRDENLVRSVDRIR